MKNILLSIILIFSFLSCKSATNQDTLPRFLINGSDTAVVLSLEQAQKLDSDEELLLLLKKSKINCDSLGNYYIKVIDDKNVTISLLKIKILKGESEAIILNRIISKLKADISKYEENELLYEKELKNNKTANNVLVKEIKRQKFRKVIAWISTSAIGILYIVSVVK